MDGWDKFYQAVVDETQKGVWERLDRFRISLGDWFYPTINWPPPDWRDQLYRFVEHTRYYGLIIEQDAIDRFRYLIEARVNGTGPFVELGPYRFDQPPAATGAQVQLAMGVSMDDGTRSDAAAATKSPRRPSVPRPKNAGDLNPDDYTPASQETIRRLGPDWKDVRVATITQLRDAGQAIQQTTGAALGGGSNALGVEAFVRLDRKDEGVDTAHFRFVWPWFSAARYEFVALKRGAAPDKEAAEAAAREKIRHADVMRVRGAINRLQGGMFAIVGGAAGIVEGAPILGTLEAAAGAEQAALAGADLATGRENRAWSSRAVQAVLEAAGVDAATAKFLAEHGGLFAALSRAAVDAAGTAHAVIETSTGYRIELEFDKATLSASGLGGAKIKVTRRFAPDGTEIKRIGGRFPINSKKYAGGVMPASEWPEAVAKKYSNGVRFTSEGFPDFSPYAVKTVKLKGLTGDIGPDKRLANRAAGLSETPDGYTWHHHEDGTTMQLVPTDLHEAVRHTGGSAVIRHE